MPSYDEETKTSNQTKKRSKTMDKADRKKSDKKTKKKSRNKKGKDKDKNPSSLTSMKRLVEYSDVSSEALSSPEAGEIQSEDSDDYSDYNVNKKYAYRDSGFSDPYATPGTERHWDPECHSRKRKRSVTSEDACRHLRDKKKKKDKKKSPTHKKKKRKKSKTGERRYLEDKDYNAEDHKFDFLPYHEGTSPPPEKILAPTILRTISPVLCDTIVYSPHTPPHPPRNGKERSPEGKDRSYHRPRSKTPSSRRRHDSPADYKRRDSPNYSRRQETHEYSKRRDSPNSYQKRRDSPDYKRNSPSEYKRRRTPEPTDYHHKARTHRRSSVSPHSSHRSRRTPPATDHRYLV